MLVGSYEGVIYVAWGSPEGLGEPEHLLDLAGNPIHTGTFWHLKKEKHVDAIPNGARVTSAIPVDWDNDGDLDLLHGTRGSKMYVRLNEGSATKPAFATSFRPVMADSKPAIVPSAYSIPVLADWDGDGKKDLLTGSSQHVFWFRNVGNGKEFQFESARQLVSGMYMQGPGSNKQIDVVDFDNDGDMDLLLGSNETTGGKSHVWLYRRKSIVDPAKVAKIVAKESSLRGDKGHVELRTDQQPVFDLDQPSSALRKLPDSRLPTGSIETGVGIKLIRIEAQRFTMGSPSAESGRDVDELQREVEITTPYWLGETEVTQKQWRELMGTEPWDGKLHVEIGDDIAATYISWHDGIEFCAELTRVERSAGGLPNGYRYDLPTEAEWELACRAGTKTRWSCDESEVKQFVAYDDSVRHISDVRQLQPNAWGFYGMHGNAAEWCADLISFNGKVNSSGDTQQRDPVGKVGESRALRGGSFRNTADGCRSAFRDSDRPLTKTFLNGFRVALVANSNNMNVRERLKGTPLKIARVPDTAPYRLTAAAEKEKVTVRIELEEGWYAYAKSGGTGLPVKVTAKGGDSMLGDFHVPESSDGRLKGTFELVQELKLPPDQEAIELVLQLMVCNENMCRPPRSIRLSGSVATP